MNYKNKFLVPTILSTTALLTIHNTASADAYEDSDEAEENIHNIDESLVDTIEQAEVENVDVEVDDDLIHAEDVIEVVEEDSDKAFETFIEEELAETEEVIEDDADDLLEPVDVDLLGDDVTVEVTEDEAEEVALLSVTDEDIAVDDTALLDVTEEAVEDTAEEVLEDDTALEDVTEEAAEDTAEEVLEDNTALEDVTEEAAEDTAEEVLEDDTALEDVTEEAAEDTVAEDTITISEEDLAAIETVVESLTEDEKAVILEAEAETLEVDEAFYQDVAAMLSAHDEDLAAEIYTWGKSSKTTLSNAISDINRYIERNGFNAPNVTYNHVAHFPEYEYRDGKGKPDGIVIHDVGNPNSTIHDEIAYMSRNWQNAFVHAFVDKDHIIQIADTDNLAWGAGRYSNQRHIQIELVHHDNAHDFAKSINNYADYVANLLYKYKLPATNADSSNGDGTIWSHEGVSHILGGTASPDPHQYFAKFGYTYNEFVNLIGNKYDDLYHDRVAPSLQLPVEQNTTSKVGTVNPGNRGIYQSVSDVRTSNASQYTGGTFTINRSAVYNYDTYYLLENDKGVIGWMHEADVNIQDRGSSVGGQAPAPTPEPEVKPTPKPTPVPSPKPETSPVVNTSVETINAKPVRVIDGTVQVFSSVYSNTDNFTLASPHVGQTLYAKETITRNNNGYYGVSRTENGPRIGWIKVGELNDYTPPAKPAPAPVKPSTPETTGHKDEVKLSNNARILGSVFNQNSFLSGNTFARENLFANETYTHNNVKYYGVSKSINGARLGWVNANQLNFINASVAPKPKPEVTKPTPTPKPTPKPSAPESTGHKDEVKLNSNVRILGSVFNQSNSIAGNAFAKDNLFVKETYTHNNVKYYGVSKSLNGARLGWVKASDLSFVNNTPAPTPKPAPAKPETNRPNTNVTSVQPTSVNINGSNVRLYSSVYSGSSISANPFVSSNLYATETVTYNNVKYFGVSRSQNGVRVGWVREQDLKFPTVTVTPPSSSGSETPNAALGSNAVRVGNDVNIYYSVFSNNAMSSRPFSNSMLYTSETFKHNNVTYYSVSRTKNGARLGWVRENDLRFVSVGNEGTAAPSPELTPPKQDVGFIGEAAVYTDKNINFTLSQMLNKQLSTPWKPQFNNGNGWRNATAAEVEKYLNPDNYNSDTLRYSFLELDKAQDIDPDAMNRGLLVSKGTLTNQGNAFSQAAKQHGVNEVYLISHALLETGHGTSRLASGVTLDANGNLSDNGKTYYNMFGIGAVDHNALLGGARHAQKMGWDTPEKAITGGAEFISNGYLARGQNTLYSMRWNPENPGSHQYATDVTWASKNAEMMNRYYQQLGLEGKYFSRYNLK